MHRDALVELTDITVVKNGRVVIEGLSLRIDAGEHTAILGPNGAGKTTLLNLLTYTEHALRHAGDPARVKVFGQERWDVFALRSQIGVVTHDVHELFVGGNSVGAIRARDAVVSGFFATRGVLEYVVVTPEMRQRAMEALARVGAAHLADVPLDRMSTGEARRVLIARALAPGPRALVLDEPTAGLDLVARGAVLDIVRAIAAEGVTIVLVTHHVEEIVPEIRRVVLLKAGRIAADGAKEQLLSAESLSALYDAPVTVERDDGFYHARPVRI
jgi:iron complex transport system ATP-binding protein